MHNAWEGDGKSHSNLDLARGIDRLFLKASMCSNSNIKLVPPLGFGSLEATNSYQVKHYCLSLPPVL